MMAFRDDIYAHLQAIGQLVEQLCETPSVDGSSQPQQPDADAAGASMSETDHSQLSNELASSRLELERLRLQNNALTAECDSLRQQLSASETALCGLAKESEDLKSKISAFTTDRERLEVTVSSLLSREESLESEVAGLKMDLEGKDLSIKQLKSEKADLEVQNERQSGALKRSLGLLLPGYVLDESEGALKSVFKALDDGRLNEMTPGDRRKISALLFFGILRNALESAAAPLTFESGSQGRRILDILRTLGEFIAHSVEDPSQAEKNLEFWAVKIIASSDILSDAFSIEVPFVGQAFNSAVMMPSNPDDFLSEVSAVHSWAILTSDRSSALAKALVD